MTGMEAIWMGVSAALAVGWAVHAALERRRVKEVLREAETARFGLAEANVDLLEKGELVEQQKFKLAEANIQLLEQKETIEFERQRSEKLLLNVLPLKIANELKEKGATEPECFDDVTVFFSDIVGFTRKAADIEPKRLISELNEMFTAFDRVIAANGCERIKTIGDAYMAVCGIPERDPKHAENILNSAIEILRYLRERSGIAEIPWEIRVGVHSGSVVGGVVGVDKYIYDVFGDTINTASRMEAHSEPSRVNVSEATYQLTKDRFPYISRGLVDAKGKGPMPMYFLDIDRAPSRQLAAAPETTA